MYLPHHKIDLHKPTILFSQAGNESIEQMTPAGQEAGSYTLDPTAMSNVSAPMEWLRLLFSAMHEPCCGRPV